MRRSMIAGLTTLALLPLTPALAASPIDGTWKVDLGSTKLPTKPDVLLLKGGSFTCASCAPAYTIKADGQLHAVTGHDYFDAVSIRVVDPHTIMQTESKGGRQIFKMTSTVSADGKTLAVDFTDTSAANGVPVEGKGIDTRVAPAPAGAHAISGSWRTTKMDSLSDSGAKISFASTADTLSMTTPTGQSYTARFGGPAVPIKGDPAMTMAAVTRVGTHGFVETDSRKGKTVSVATITVAPDGKTLSVTQKDMVQNTTTTYKAIKQ